MSKDIGCSSCLRKVKDAVKDLEKSEHSYEGPPDAMVGTVRNPVHFKNAGLDRTERYRHKDEVHPGKYAADDCPMVLVPRHRVTASIRKLLEEVAAVLDDTIRRIADGTGCVGGPGRIDELIDRHTERFLEWEEVLDHCLDLGRFGLPNRTP
mmetsp:Transcript_58295/g.142531  ORF Transcript_58295/g.142531 Transcript_58295/m.142531 type:complete len:152 (-) Transcript_58295:961-1416(-)